MTPIAKLTKIWWRFSKGNRASVIWCMILFVLCNSVSFFEPLVIGKLLDTIQQQGLTAQSLHPILLLALLFLAIRFFFWVFYLPARVLETNNAYFVSTAYKQYLVEHVLALPSRWHLEHHSGETIDKIQKGSNAISSFSYSVRDILEMVFQFISSYAALAYFNLHASYIVIFVLLIIIVIVVRFDKRIVPRYREMNKIGNVISAKIYDILGNVQTVIILRVEKILSGDLWKRMIEPLRLYRSTTLLNETKWFSVSMCTALMTFFVLATYLWSTYLAGTAILIGTLYILYGYVDRLNGLSFRFASRYSDIVQQNTNLQNSQELLAQDMPRRVRRVHMPSTWKVLEIRRLNFAYETAKRKLHLKDVSLTFHKGERIAFIGASGSGKTTMLRLLRALYEPHDCDLFVDGKRIARNFAAISDDIALIPQDPELFNTTIAQNIAMGSDISVARMRRYTDIACATDVVERQPLKWETMLTERAVNLSGGEKQRIALARGLFACEERKIMLLDEPTSSVDARNERRIYENIFREYKSKTIISVIHRLHLLPLFDTIYFFENGKIIAHGSYEHMLKNDKFRDLLKKYAQFTYS